MSSTQVTRRSRLKARAVEAANRLTARKSGPPDDFQIRFDVRVTLRSALRDAKVKEKDIKDSWKPKDAGFDEGGWELVLTGFAASLRSTSVVYKPWKHTPRHAADTFPKALSAIEDHLSAEVARVVAKPAPSGAS